MWCNCGGNLSCCCSKTVQGELFVTDDLVITDMLDMHIQDLLQLGLIRVLIYRMRKFSFILYTNHPFHRRLHHWRETTIRVMHLKVLNYERIRPSLCVKCSEPGQKQPD